MKKLVGIAAVAMMLPTVAFAQNVGGCGVGPKLFTGQSGMGPNIFVMITDSYLDASWSVRPFAVTSGTSGCTQDGAIRSNWKTAMFIDGNKDRLARDMSIGNGETLNSLAHLIGVREEDRATFGRLMQANVWVIFPSGSTTDDSVVALKQVLRSDRELAQYAASI